MPTVSSVTHFMLQISIVNRGIVMRTLFRPITFIFDLITKPVRAIRSLQSLLFFVLIVGAVVAALAFTRPDLIRWTCPTLQNVLPQTVCAPAVANTTTRPAPPPTPTGPQIKVTTPAIGSLLLSIISCFLLFKATATALKTLAPYQVIVWVLVALTTARLVETAYIQLTSGLVSADFHNTWITTERIFIISLPFLALTWVEAFRRSGGGVQITSPIAFFSVPAVLALVAILSGFLRWPEVTPIPVVSLYDFSWQLPDAARPIPEVLLVAAIAIIWGVRLGSRTGWWWLVPCGLTLIAYVIPGMPTFTINAIFILTTYVLTELSKHYLDPLSSPSTTWLSRSSN